MPRLFPLFAPLLFLAACSSAVDAPPASASGAPAAGIVSSADPRASEAGQEILRKGGSAADAAMAMMIALTVVEPQSSGIGGGGFLLHYDAADAELSTIDGRETAPQSADETLFLDEDGKPQRFLDAFQGGQSVGIPGNIRLMAKVHEKWGKLPWADLFQPAIRLADKGFTVNATLEGRLEMLKPLWGRFPDAQAIYWENGEPKKRGMTVRNPDLAALLRKVAAEGPDAFYKGEAGQAIVDAVADAPVNAVTMTAEELAAYDAVERAPVCGNYREYRICGMGPPSSGATTILQILGALEPFDLAAMGKDDPQAWHLIAEAMQLAYADREKYLGDPEFVSVPVEGMLSKSYLAGRSALISPDKVRADYPAGDPPGAEARTAGISSEVAGTTHFVAIDKAGNIVSMTSTVEGPFGSQLIANGFFLNNELTDFTFVPEQDGAPVANRVQPGKRPLSSMSPTLVFDRSGRPVLALGSAGGKRIIMHVAKTLIGYIDFDLPADEAIALPNIYFGRDAVLVEQGTSLADKAKDLARYGSTVAASDLPSKVNAVALTPQGWRGYADPRSEGVALTQ